VSYYHVCPNCQANLDPGERCDCNTIKQPLSDRLIVAFDSAQNGDCACITIVRMGMKGNYEVLNSFYDDEAREIYSKLITQAPEGKVKIL
jgi:hypothetical protein